MYRMNIIIVFVQLVLVIEDQGAQKLIEKKSTKKPLRATLL